MMRHGMQAYHGGGHMMMGGITHMLLWVLLILLIIMLVRRARRRDAFLEKMGMGGSRMNTSALDILKERYAKGEINKTEFEEKKKDLMS